jgi:hypothetical protein
MISFSRIPGVVWRAALTHSRAAFAFHFSKGTSRLATQFRAAIGQR